MSRPIQTSKLLTILLLSLSLLIGPFGLVSAEEETSLFSSVEKEWIAEHPTARIRISRDYAPFEFFTDQRYQGIAYDYLQIVSEKTGINFQPVEDLTWSESLQALRDGGELDMVLLITHTTERESFLVFTDDYIRFDLVVFSDRNNSELLDFSALNGKTVAVEKGYITFDWLQRDVPGIQLLEVENTTEALRAVSQGRADAYVGNLATGTWLVDREGFTNLQVSGSTPYGKDSLAMGIRKDWPQLARIINTVLKSIPQEHHQQIRNRWLPLRYEYAYSVPDVLLWLAGIVFIGLIWIVQLRLVVKRRTSALRHEIDIRAEKEVELMMSMDYLKNTHQRLRFNIDRMPLAYIVWDKDFVVREWNPAAERIFGWTEEEARGKNAHELIVTQEAKDAVEQVWQSLMQGNDSSSSINENITKDGTRLICSWYSTSLHDSDGAVSGAISMVEDITQRYDEQKARDQQFEQLSKIFDSINALVYVADMQTFELLYLNQLSLETFGENWQGKKCFELLQTGMTERCSFCTNDKLLVDGEAGPPFIWEFQNSINKRWYQCIDRAIPWVDGKLVRMEIAFDITETKEIEKIKEGMISAVSHEMRTPLTVVLGYAEFLLNNQVDPVETKEHVRTLYAEAEKLNELIDNFLNLQQLKAGQQPLSFFAVDACTMLNDIQRDLTKNKSPHEIVVECPADLTPIKGDTVQLRAAVYQVVSNAIKFSPDGGRICLKAEQVEQMINIYISDLGVGIPPVALGKVFDRFYRVDNTDTREFGGVGIGLSLVHDIVATHNGKVWAESEKGEGTTITLSFPVYD